VTRRDGVVQRRQFSGGDVEVGAADAAGFYLEQNFTRSGSGDGMFFDRERTRGKGRGLMKDGGAHLSID
jgi:hypothetical protein